MINVTYVKVYLTEGDKLLNAVMGYLHDEVKVRGVTVVRAISGFGKSGIMHSSHLLTASLNLPLVIEFFDTSDKIKPILDYLPSLVGEGHTICWDGLAY